MPRPTTLPQSSLRNRNRLTNKTRLKIHQGNVDADLLIPDEDEEKARLLQSVAGVDQEDANEHHLQAVLSESSSARRGRDTRGAANTKATAPAAAFIPTPDSTGIVDDYTILYPPNKLAESTSYLKFSQTVEECVSGALAHGCTYYMDERDKDWLDKINEEARGEGTSAQGSLVSPSRSSARSTKAKGKEPESNSPVSISEDEFELVMGVFELVTHEKTEFLCHGFDMKTFPPFSDYQDVFGSPLPARMFAKFGQPNSLPSPANLLRLSRVIYPYWRERRTERAGKRIIPTVNGDETDTLNESYVCFRRREVKTSRKLRNSQTSVPERFKRFTEEWAVPEQLLQAIVHRENVKREHLVHSAHVMSARLEMLDLMKKNPGLAEKRDEELLIDREKPAKRHPESRPGVRIPSKNDFGAPNPNIKAQAVEKPRNLLASILQKTDEDLARRKERDREWEDVLDYPYQTAPVKAFKTIPRLDPQRRMSSPSSISSDSDSGNVTRGARSIRLRFGRGGRTILDRRIAVSNPSSLTRARLRPSEPDSEDEDKPELARRLQERWRFDEEGSTGGMDEQDRVLIDENEPKYQANLINVHQAADLLFTDPVIFKHYADGREEAVPGFVRDAPFQQRQSAPHPGRVMQISQAAQAAQQQHLLANGAPVSVMQHMKLPPGVVQQHLRISNGGMPGTQTSPPQQHVLPPGASAPPPQASPPPPPLPFQPPPMKIKNTTPAPSQQAPPPSSASRITFAHPVAAGTIIQPRPPQTEALFAAPTNFIQRPKSQGVQQQMPTAGYYQAANGYPAPQGGGNPLTAQQMANFQNTYANPPKVATGYGAGAGFNVPLMSGGSLNLRLPPQRAKQMQQQWDPRVAQDDSGQVPMMRTVSRNGDQGSPTPPPQQQGSPRLQTPVRPQSVPQHGQ